MTAAALRGRPVVVTFIYSTCEDTCPGQVQSIRGALDDLGRDVPVIGVSVDPANDTPRTRAGVPARAVDDRPDGLPARQPRGAAAACGRRSGSRRSATGRDHSAYTVLVDGEGRQRIGFPVSELTPRRLAHDLARL